MSTNPNTIKNQDCRNCKLSDEECSFGCVKSQDELNLCNEGKRKSDVLLEAISKAERLQKQLDIAKGFIFRCANDIAGDWYVNAAKCVQQEIEELDNENT